MKLDAVESGLPHLRDRFDKAVNDPADSRSRQAACSFRWKMEKRCPKASTHVSHFQLRHDLAARPGTVSHIGQPVNPLRCGDRHR